LAPLNTASDVEWISLQKDPRALPPLPLRDFTVDLTDLAETAALVMNLDLLITADTAVAHLAGALGRPVWVLLPYAPDWRWMLDRADSPWYPTATLFRQPRPRDWQSVLREVVVRLGGS
jgi:ADP-heptose:LPS heptosyltransferase